MPVKMTLYGYFHYFADDIMVNRENISRKEAREILLMKKLFGKNQMKLI